MTREEAKKLLPIIQAYAEGKTIQFRICKNKWVDIEDPSFEVRINYSIKSEAMYRPFTDCLECWEEMHKHSNFGWIKHKLNSNVCQFYIVGNIVNIEGSLEVFLNASKILNLPMAHHSA